MSFVIFVSAYTLIVALILASKNREWGETAFNSRYTGHLAGFEAKVAEAEMWHYTAKCWRWTAALSATILVSVLVWIYFIPESPITAAVVGATGAGIVALLLRVASETDAENAQLRADITLANRHRDFAREMALKDLLPRLDNLLNRAKELEAERDALKDQLAIRARGET